MHGQLSADEQQSQVMTWPRQVREEYLAQVDALLWTRWYTRAEAEALAWRNLHALGQAA